MLELCVGLASMLVVVVVVIILAWMDETFGKQAILFVVAGEHSRELCYSA